MTAPKKVITQQPADPWIHRSTMMQCKTCIWYVPKLSTDGEHRLGRCRKSAPVVGEGYPVVFPVDWCGQHKLDENKTQN